VSANPEGLTQPASRRTLRLLSKLSGALAPLSFLLLLFIILSLKVPHFLQRDNLKLIAVQAAVVAVLACARERAART